MKKQHESREFRNKFALVIQIGRSLHWILFSNCLKTIRESEKLFYSPKYRSQRIAFIKSIAKLVNFHSIRRRCANVRAHPNNQQICDIPNSFHLLVNSITLTPYLRYLIDFYSFQLDKSFRIFLFIAFHCRYFCLPSVVQASRTLHWMAKNDLKLEKTKKVHFFGALSFLFN